MTSTTLKKEWVVTSGVPPCLMIGGRNPDDLRRCHRTVEGTSAELGTLRSTCTPAVVVQIHLYFSSHYLCPLKHDDDDDDDDESKMEVRV